METNAALAALSALSQSMRLETVRLLIQAGPGGMTAGEIAEALGARPNTLSANLAVLLQAGLVRNQREGRSVRYFADMEGMQGLIGFLMEDCCGGRPEPCQPAIAQLSEAC